MSTPRPQESMPLPTHRSYTITIKNFPAGHPGLMSFSNSRDPFIQMADYLVPNVQLAHRNCPVTPKGQQVKFEFTVTNATEEQKLAGYVDGKYTFTFVPPTENTEEFVGQLNHPKADQAEDTFTAKGNEPISAAKGNETKSEC
jgi:hypothetical protein